MTIFFFNQNVFSGIFFHCLGPENTILKRKEEYRYVAMKSILFQHFFSQLSIFYAEAKGPEEKYPERFMTIIKNKEKSIDHNY